MKLIEINNTSTEVYICYIESLVFRTQSDSCSKSSVIVKAVLYIFTTIWEVVYEFGYKVSIGEFTETFSNTFKSNSNFKVSIH